MPEPTPLQLPSQLSAVAARQTKTRIGKAYDDGTYAPQTVTLAASATVGATSLTLSAPPTKPLRKNDIIVFSAGFAVVTADSSGTSVAVEALEAALANGATGTVTPLPLFSGDELGETVTLPDPTAETQTIKLFAGSTIQVYDGTSYQNQVVDLTLVDTDWRVVWLQRKAHPDSNDRTVDYIVLDGDGGGKSGRGTIVSLERLREAGKNLAWRVTIAPIKEYAFRSNSKYVTPAV